MSETTYGVIGAIQMIKPGSVGATYKGVYTKVVDENGKSLGPNQPGELCFKGLRIMKGYVNDPKATSEAFDKDGWLHSGDIGYYDDDKQFFIVDRLKELIKYKAYQVPPAGLLQLKSLNFDDLTKFFQKLKDFCCQTRRSKIVESSEFLTRLLANFLTRLL